MIVAGPSLMLEVILQIALLVRGLADAGRVTVLVDVSRNRTPSFSISRTIGIRFEPPVPRACHRERTSPYQTRTLWIELPSGYEELHPRTIVPHSDVEPSIECMSLFQLFEVRLYSEPGQLR